MSAYLKKGWYYGRCWHPDRQQSVGVALGTRDAKDAESIRVFLRQLKRSARTDVLSAIVSHQLSPVQAWIAHVELRLPDAVNDARSRAKEAQDEIADTDLSPLVDDWNGRGRKTRSEKYVRQVRAMIPKGVRFPKSKFTRAAIATFLDGLDVQDPTRNRYRAALSAFGWWLVTRDYIPSNPVMSVPGFSENDAQIIYYTPEQAKRILDALPQPYQALEALMCATSIEWGAAIALRARDIDVEAMTVIAHGTKTRYRRHRTIRITEEWCLPYITAHLQYVHPNAQVFKGLNPKKALEVHKEALTAVGAEPSVLHSWRHVYAVQALKDGVSEQAIKKQLGHALNSVMLRKVYGVYFPDDADYTKRIARPESRYQSATPTRKAINAK